MSHLCECKREVFGKQNGKLLFFGKVHGHIEFQVNASLAAGCYLIIELLVSVGTHRTFTRLIDNVFTARLS